MAKSSIRIIWLGCVLPFCLNLVDIVQFCAQPLQRVEVEVAHRLSCARS